MRPSIRTFLGYLKLLGALAALVLFGVLMLSLGGCKTAPTVPLELPQPRYSRSPARSPTRSLSSPSPVGLFALSSPSRVATEKGHQPRDGVAFPQTPDPIR